MTEPGGFLASPALASRWRGAAATDAAARWRAQPALRLGGALEPGLAAEVATWLARLPLDVASSADAVWWSCEVDVPAQPDPQLPEPAYRLVRLLDTDLPGLLGTITGRALTRPAAGRVTVRAWRKGSFADAPAAPVSDAPSDAIDVVLGLTGARWPAAWGGTLELTLGATTVRRPPAWDTLDVHAAALPGRVTLVSHDVEVVTVIARYAPAEPATP